MSLLTVGSFVPSKISYALVDFTSISRLLRLRGSRHLPIMTNVVDVIYRQAAATKAAVHSLVGDVVHLSWNATQRVPQPEAKASRFLAIVRKELAESTGGIIPGAVCSGHAISCLLASSTKQQAVVIHASWMGRLNAMLALAKENKCLLADANTQLVAHFTVEFLAIDVVTADVPMKIVATEDHEEAHHLVDETFSFMCNGTVKPSTAASLFENSSASGSQQVTSFMYTLVKEHQRQDDEWMYQLQAAESKDTTKMQPAALITAATEKAKEKKYGEAIELLHQTENVSNSGTGSTSPSRGGGTLNTDSSLGERLELVTVETPIVRRLRAFSEAMLQRST